MTLDQALLEIARSQVLLTELVSEMRREKAAA